MSGKRGKIVKGKNWMVWQLDDVDQFTKAEETVLARDKEGGDMVARERLILSCLPYAVLIASRMVQRIENIAMRDQRRDEAVSDAMLGLVRAVDALKPNRGRLTTLTSLCVKQEVWKHWRLYRGAIYVPNCAVDTKQNPSQEMIDKAAKAASGVPLDKLTGRNATDNGVNDPAMIVETKDEVRKAMDVFLRLGEREQDVVSRVVMQGEKLADVGETQGVSKQLICNVKQRALRRLRGELCE